VESVTPREGRGSSLHLGSWGDQGDGTYRNPILNADYPDVDVEQVGDTYYMISSKQHMAPGMVVLESRDMVNWTTIGHVWPTLSWAPEYNWDRMDGYACGVYAGDLAYHDGTWYCYLHSRVRQVDGRPSGFLLLERPPRGRAFRRRLVPLRLRRSQGRRGELQMKPDELPGVVQETVKDILEAQKPGRLSELRHEGSRYFELPVRLPGISTRKRRL
jgi:hypothetical protein